MLIKILIFMDGDRDITEEQKVLNKQEFFYIEPTKIVGKRIKYSLTYEEYLAIRHALNSLKKSRLSSRFYANKHLVLNSRNKKKPIFLLKDVDLSFLL